MSTIQSIREGPAPLATGRAPHQGKSIAAGGADREAPRVADLPAIDPEAARALAQQVQKALDRAVPPPHKVVFRPDETTHGYVIEVRNPDGSLVRQYPPEKLLNLRRKLDELSGMVIDEVT